MDENRKSQLVDWMRREPNEVAKSYIDMSDILLSLTKKVEQYAESGCIDAYIVQDDLDDLSSHVDQAIEFLEVLYKRKSNSSPSGES